MKGGGRWLVMISSLRAHPDRKSRLTTTRGGGARELQEAVQRVCEGGGGLGGVFVCERSPESARLCVVPG